jgi:S1-C subfamily serine protease
MAVGVVAVAENSPAAAAGLEPRDIITHLNGQTMSSVDDLQRFLGRADVATPVEMRFLRRYVPNVTRVTLAEADA